MKATIRLRPRASSPSTGWHSLRKAPVLLQLFPLMNDRPEVDTGILVGTCKLDEVVAFHIIIKTYKRFAFRRGYSELQFLLHQHIQQYHCLRQCSSTRESRATASSIPVPTSGTSGFSSGTAWRIMFDPINARLASSCSRNGINDAAIEAIWLGATSIRSIWCDPQLDNQPDNAPLRFVGNIAVFSNGCTCLRNNLVFFFFGTQVDRSFL
jgi:hypothetical protein